MDSQQLLPQCQVLQHKVFAGSKCADKPGYKVPRQRVMAILADGQCPTSPQVPHSMDRQNFGERQLNSNRNAPTHGASCGCGKYQFPAFSSSLEAKARSYLSLGRRDLVDTGNLMLQCFDGRRTVGAVLDVDAAGFGITRPE